MTTQEKCLCGDNICPGLQTCGRLLCTKRRFEQLQRVQDMIDWGIEGLAAFEEAIGKPR